MCSKGSFFGNSQTKFLNSTRLYLGSNCKVITISYGGADAVLLGRELKKISKDFGHLDFIALNVGGKDLTKGLNVPEIVEDIKVRAENFVQ